MQASESFQIYDFLKERIKSANFSLIIVSSLLTNWDFVYFLVRTDLAPSRAIEKALELHFSPYAFLIVFFSLSLLSPLILVLAKTVFNLVHIPTEKLFNQLVKKISYPTMSQFRRLEKQYDELKSQYQSSDIYKELRSEKESLENDNLELKEEIQAYKNLISDMQSKRESESEVASEEQPKMKEFLKSYHFGKSTQAAAEALIVKLKNEIKGDLFTLDQILIDPPSTEIKFNKHHVEDAISRLNEGVLLIDTESVSSFSIPGNEYNYRLTNEGRKLILDNMTIG